METKLVKPSMENTAILELRLRDVVHKLLVLFHDKLLLLRRMETDTVLLESGPYELISLDIVLIY